MTMAAGLGAALLGAALAAQEPAPKPTTAPDPSRAPKSVATQVHEAWLTEVLDLDVRGAAEDYDRIQKQAPRNRPERWIAVTRLAELKKLGVLSPEPASIAQAPEAVRKAIDELPTPPSAAQLLANPSEEQLLPPLHSATEAVQSWVRMQFGANAAAGPRGRPRFRRWAPSPIWSAADVLRVELSHRKEQAQALRSLYFANWKPPEVTGDPSERLATVRQRLTIWLDEQGPETLQHSLLKELGDALDAEAEKGPEQALALLSRLPIYAERLILDQRQDPDPSPGNSGGNGPGGGNGSGSSSSGAGGGRR